MKKTLIIIVSIIGVIIFSLILLLFFTTNKCDKNLPFDLHNLCLYTASINSDNIDICNEAKTLGVKYRCITNYAEKKGDITTCKNLPEFESQECTTLVAIKTKDLNICKTLQSKDYQISCENQVQIKSAVESNDEQVCESVQGLSQKDICYASVAIKKGDTKICEKIITSYSTVCYMQIAKNKNDSQICYSITNNSDIEYCLKQF